MRFGRLKVNPEEAVASYHLYNHLLAEVPDLDDEEREYLRLLLWRVADFSGLRMLTYCVMHNHFHVQVVVPRKTPLEDAELLRRFHVLHPPEGPRPWLGGMSEEQLARNDEAVQTWRVRLLAQMGDISPFMKQVKQRFTQWYVKRHQRKGTIWEDRFRSQLDEPVPAVMTPVAAYVDLNAVRAGLVPDPLDYRWCGYGEAVAGNEAARLGLRTALGFDSECPWENVQRQYRLLLFGKGSAPREGKAAVSRELQLEVLRKGGRLELSELLLFQVRYFTEGRILGIRQFVDRYWKPHRRNQGMRAHSTFRPAAGTSGLPSIGFPHRFRGREIVVAGG